ncbi:preprotein translocase subunit SecA [Candidatus Berkelbacteria bacterium CG10_big_fil_rev_8_21_14_0_10_43_14]|uniref:Protein translocase subunit SecA n=1 Tax=Candidatus Berkelbacteria bacterium CG10_big_fil_rev_8_21_14_0_10_43_14 TaxID=1974515 RepID=A0A2M6R7T3_9BACT|nr:MAG: preprotein translocase subunit SecA [Candidatus Berkelbacteria bacterium CG10_big_fil_rev_8_21_14_0_10_43_14]
MGLLDKFFGPSETKTVSAYKKHVEHVQGFEDHFVKLSDDELKQLTHKLRSRLGKGEISNDLLAEAFAGVREAARRTIGQRHFDVQCIGGAVLHDGKIAEMRTGEGKTLVATLPLYLNALEGKGAHLVTVNDFLAKFQGQWMGSVFDALGMTTGIIGHEQSWVYSKEPQDNDDETWRHLIPVSRKQAYDADITYGTNNEFGFDYLRDNMVGSSQQKVQRGLHFAIVDEVDSILIDEARTPLIISAPARESTNLYQQFAQLVKRLKTDDYIMDEKDRAVNLTDGGIHKMEAWLGVANLYDPNNVTLIHHGEEALKAQVLFKRDKDYVVKDGEIVIVDEFTGRMMLGRRYSEGLHQAIEAKEGVEVKRESETLATISFQNLFRIYSKLAGMTGTAATETEEFYKIYGLEVVIIPTNKPMVRSDHQDRIYKTEEGKYNAVVKEIKERSERGQPVLVGTVSISKNEKLSKLLKLEGVKHQMLNAKHHEQEAKIIAQAGRLGAVTIATNIAGRGVDIILGGTAPEKTQNSKLKTQNKDETEEIGLKVLTHDRRTLEQWQEEHNKVVDCGGLCVVGTERHESRRIDNQLRGRAGRQGDPGESVFFVSMEDDLMRIFGGERLKGMMDKLGLPDDMPITHGLVSKSIEQAQKKVEGHNFDIRKHLVEYDDVMNKHREAIYRKRNLVLDGKGKVDDQEVDIHDEILSLFADDEQPLYEQKVKRYGMDTMRSIEQQVYVRVIDQLWIDHLNAMDELRTGIGLRGYGQKDPLVEYKQESFRMFERLLDTIEAQAIDILVKAEIVAHPNQIQQRPMQVIEQGAVDKASGDVMEEELQTEQVQPTQSSAFLPESNNPSGGVEITVRKKGSVIEQSLMGSAMKKVGRNDPCPCGSGKKYKKCHGK